MKDLVQIDIETAIVLYSKGYKHIPIMQGDPFSEDWTSKQPLYLDDLLESLVIFASDSKRAELMNSPKTDIGKVKESIAMDYKPYFRIDPEEDEEDDDPDWVETEPEQVESIPDDDAVPESEKVLTVEQVTEQTDKQKAEELILEIQSGTREPLKWNAREAVRLNNNGVGQRSLAELYGISVPTVNRRLKEYRSKS